MFGPPKDVEGECNAHLYLADDYGDNQTTCRCQLPKGHTGLHTEMFLRDKKFYGLRTSNNVIITWSVDEREKQRRRKQ